MRALRIVFDASPLLVNKTGVAYYTERLITNLATAYPEQIELVGFYYNFLGRRDISHLPKAPNLRFHGVHVIPSKVLFQLRRWGIECPIEILSGTTADFVLYPNFLSYPSLRKTPSAPVIHDLTYIDLPEYVARKNGSDLKRFVPKAIKRSSFVLTVSDFTKRRVHEEYGLDNNRILVTPIPPEPTITFTRREESSVLLHAGIRKPYILFVGTVEPRKNIIGLMDAYTRLPKHLRDKYTLAIVGRIGWNCKDEEARIRQLRAEGYDIKHLGYIDDLIKAVLYSRASLFVSASSYEGFGMPVLEAMSYGRPVAVSDIPVFHEVAGPAGSYFNQTKPEAIATCIQNLLEDKDRLEVLGKKAKAQADSFSWQAVATDVYKRITQAIQNK